MKRSVRSPLLFLLLAALPLAAQAPPSGEYKLGPKDLVDVRVVEVPDMNGERRVSESGRIDLISAQSGNDRLVADAKIFNPDGGQNVSYIVKGFRQIYDYAKDYNEQFGYLVIFKTCEEDLSIPTPHRESAVPFITHNNRTIFFVVIDLCAYDASASKRGKLKAHEITPEQFVEAVVREDPKGI